MELTREQAIAEHRKMWNWIADRIEYKKRVLEIPYLKKVYLIEHGFRDHIKVNCFLCHYTNMNCTLCPIKWISKNKYYKCENERKSVDRKGLYAKCVDTNDWQEQAALARQIANLPEREDV